MSIPTHLMEKFLRGDCTEEEREQVAAWLRAHPEKLAQYLTDDSWKNFASHSRQEVPTERIRRTIGEAIGKTDAGPQAHDEGTVYMPVRKFRYGWAAAAAFTGAIALFFLLHKNTDDPTAPRLADARPAKVAPQPGPMHVDNVTAGTKTFILPDGSKVELSGKTAITFDSAFTAGRRAITLDHGEAVFTVKKDPRPFVVHSNGITTTALGTVFSVSDKQRLYTTVHLFSGRVVIKQAAGEKGASFKDIYLKPGQQLELNNADLTVHIRNLPQPATDAVPAHSDYAKAARQQLDFVNRPLGEIFSLLQQEYNVSITYNAAVLKNMTFSGRLDKNKDTLEGFLDMLCDLNDLTLKKNSDNSYSIQVKQP